MLACWIEDPKSDYFKKHLARVREYIWIGEDGLKIQVGAFLIMTLTYILRTQNQNPP